jgi:hypothetical protein
MEAAMTKLFEIARSAIYVLLLSVLAIVVLWNFRALDRAIQNLFVQASSIDTIEVLGLKLGFNARRVEHDLQSALENYERYNPSYFIDAGFASRADYESHILALTQGLSQKEVDRLVNVGELKNLCRFAHPDTEMRIFAAADARLVDKGLTKITDSPETFRRVRDEFAALEAKGELPAIGRPLSCYEMRRTDDGYNVRTVLIKGMSRRFGASTDAK